jgi:hypothetical protein
MFQTSPVVRHSLAMKDATAALTGLDLPALAGVEPLDLDSGFEKKLFREPGPHAYPALRGQSRPSHWRMFATHTGELRIGQLSGAARQGGLGLRVSGAETFTLSYPARVEPGQAVLARVAVRGGVGRGARVQLMLGWRDDGGRLLDEVSVDRLPAGAYPEWMDLACAAEAPAEAASFFAVLVVQYQESGDSVDLDDFTLRVRPVDEPRARP